MTREEAIAYIGNYKSPIDSIISSITSEIIEQSENAIVATIVEKVGIDIDKKELIKALNYDRDQFNEGFKAGYKQGLEEGKKIFVRQLIDSLNETYGVKGDD